jgi:hypothetical protein
LCRQNSNADDEIATGVRESRRAAGGMPIADLECTMTTNDDPFEPIEDLAAVRGGPCAGVWWLYDILCRGGDAGGAARPRWSPGLEADLAAVADIKRSTSSDRTAPPADRTDIQSASGGSAGSPRVGIP